MKLRGEGMRGGRAAPRAFREVLELGQEGGVEELLLRHVPRLGRPSLVGQRGSSPPPRGGPRGLRQSIKGGGPAASLPDSPLEAIVVERFSGLRAPWRCGSSRR